MFGRFSPTAHYAPRDWIFPWNPYVRGATGGAAIAGGGGDGNQRRRWGWEAMAERIGEGKNAGWFESLIGSPVLPAPLPTKSAYAVVSSGGKCGTPASILPSRPRPHCTGVWAEAAS